MFSVQSVTVYSKLLLYPKFNPGPSHFRLSRINWLYCRFIKEFHWVFTFHAQTITLFLRLNNNVSLFNTARFTWFFPRIYIADIDKNVLNCYSIALPAGACKFINRIVYIFHFPRNCVLWNIYRAWNLVDFNPCKRLERKQSRRMQHAFFSTWQTESTYNKFYLWPFYCEAPNHPLTVLKYNLLGDRNPTSLVLVVKTRLLG